jgi:opacity protein-like surface antigen
MNRNNIYQIILALVLIPAGLYSQKSGFGIKLGVNFANVTNASSINSSNQAGFHGGLIFAPDSKSILGSRTELVYSRQGYNYANGAQSGAVNLDYLMFAQLMAINITKFVQIQLGGQMAYLLNAKASSSSAYNTGNSQVNSLIDYYNRFDYGFGAGVEVHPIAGLLIGARYNFSLADLYKQPSSTSTESPPPFIPSTSDINLKNSLFQLFAGYRF